MPRKTNNKDICEICGVEQGKKKFHTHHVTYKEDGVTEITMEICQPCHNLVHGRRVCGHVLFPRKYKQKSDKGLAMVNFALRFLQAFLRKMKWVLVINKDGMNFYTYKFLKVLEREMIKTEEINKVDKILENYDDEETTH